MLKNKEITPQIIERAFRKKPLTEEQKENNKSKSKIRCRCEHAFGFVTNSMGDFYIRSIGFLRAKGVIGLINLVYNYVSIRTDSAIESFTGQVLMKIDVSRR
jgi:hypothetical protein